MPYSKSVLASDEQDAALGHMTLDFLNRSKYWLLVGALLGGGAGLGASFLMRPQWEASTLMQVGQIAGDEAAPATPLEQPARTVDRMKSPQFLEAVAGRLGLRQAAGAPSPDADLLVKSANVNLLRNSDLIQVSVHGYSAEQARQFIKAVEGEITSVHATLAKPTVDRLKAEQASLDQALSVEGARRSDLQKFTQEEFRGDVARRFSEGVLITQMQTASDTASRQLERRQRALKEQLDPVRTFNTRAMGPESVSAQPVFPRKPPLIGAGILAGLAAAAFLRLIFWARGKRG